MTTLNNTQIITAITNEYKKTNEQMIAQAKKAVEALQHNLSIKEIGDHDWQVEQAIEHVKGFKDVAILDEAQGNVLTRFIVDDEQIEDLDVYDQTCDLRTDYQDHLNNAIDDVIDQIKNLPKAIATDFDHNYHSSQKHYNSYTCIDYVLHNADIFNEISYNGSRWQAVYQAGQHFINNDYSAPSTKFELTDEAGTDAVLAKINNLCESDFENNDMQWHIDDIADPAIKTKQDLRAVYSALMDNNCLAQQEAYSLFEHNEDFEPVFIDFD